MILELAYYHQHHQNLDVSVFVINTLYYRYFLQPHFELQIQTSSTGGRKLICLRFVCMYCTCTVIDKRRQLLLCFCPSIQKKNTMECW